VKSRELSQNKNVRNSARVNDASDFKIPRDKKPKSEFETVFLVIKAREI
jgi:hypothetical protein